MSGPGSSNDPPYPAMVYNENGVLVVRPIVEDLTDSQVRSARRKACRAELARIKAAAVAARLAHISNKRFKRHDVRPTGL
eukprot:8665800-Heterocapsa_arctica.AAC.1